MWVFVGVTHAFYSAAARPCFCPSIFQGTSLRLYCPGCLHTCIFRGTSPPLVFSEVCLFWCIFKGKAASLSQYIPRYVFTPVFSEVCLHPCIFRGISSPLYFQRYVFTPILSEVCLFWCIFKGKATSLSQYIPRYVLTPVFSEVHLHPWFFFQRYVSALVFSEVYLFWCIFTGKAACLSQYIPRYVLTLYFQRYIFTPVFSEICLYLCIFKGICSLQCYPEDISGSIQSKHLYQYYPGYNLTLVLFSDHVLSPVFSCARLYTEMSLVRLKLSIISGYVERTRSSKHENVSQNTKEPFARTRALLLQRGTSQNNTHPHCNEGCVGVGVGESECLTQSPLQSLSV